MRACQFLTLNIIVVVLSSGIYAEEPSDPDSETIEVSVPLKAQYGSLYGSVDIGVVPADSRPRILLRFTNPTNHEIDTAYLKASCSCVQARQSGDHIDPLGSHEVSFAATVPKTSKVPNGAWRLTLGPAKDGKPSVHLRVEYRLAGLVSFIDQNAVFKASSDEESVSYFKIPVLITPPVDPTKVQITLPDDFEGISARIGTSEDLKFLELKVPNKFVGGAGLSGLVVCTDPQSGRADEIFCLIEKASGLTVYPAILRLKRQGTGESYAATALLQLDFPMSSSGSGEAEGNAIVGATFRGKDVVLNPVHISTRVVKAKVVISGQDIQEVGVKGIANETLSWTVRTKRGVFRCRSRMFATE